MNLSNNSIVITGGSSGIGLELARVLVKKANQVIICGRSMEKLEQAKKEIPSLQIVQCDLSQSIERNNLADWIKKNHPECNIFINNAAMVHKTNFFSDADIIEKAELEIQTNLMAPIELTKLIFPLLEKNEDSKIIYVTTGLVYTPKAAYPIYCATKSALHSFIKTLRSQKNDRHVNILEILLPAVDTPFHKGDPPKISISPEKAVKEIIQKLEKDVKDIRVGGTKILHYLSRIAPTFTFNRLNSMK